MFPDSIPRDSIARDAVARYTGDMFKNLNLGALGHSAAFDVTCALAKKHGFAGVDLDLGYLAKLGAASAARDWFAAID